VWPRCLQVHGCARARRRPRTRSAGPGDLLGLGEQCLGLTQSLRSGVFKSNAEEQSRRNVKDFQNVENMAQLQRDGAGEDTAGGADAGAELSFELSKGNALDPDQGFEQSGNALSSRVRSLGNHGGKCTTLREKPCRRSRDGSTMPAMAGRGRVLRGPYRTSVRNKKVLLSFTEDEFARLVEAAETEGRATATLARVVVTEWLERRERRKPPG